MKINTIIFDLDNVLVTMSDSHYHALNKALKYFNYDPIPYDVHLKKFNGLSTRKKLDMLGISDKDIQSKIWRKKQEYTLESITNTVFPEDIKIGTMEQLTQERYNIGCVTNAIRKTAESMLYNSGVIKYIDLLICNDDGYKNKPSSEPYSACMESFGVKPSQSLIVEDSDIGYESANNSGAFVLKVSGPNEVNYHNIKDTIDWAEYLYKD